MQNIEKTYGDAVKRGLMNDAKAKEGRARIVASTNPTEMRNVGVVIEAASEKMEIKKQIFADLGGKTPENTILATNTSALSISELGTTAGHADRVIGLHFFNPVSRMKLVEVVVGKQTAPAVVERALGFTRQIGKLPVVVQDSPGFLVNRVLFPYLLDAAELFEKGVNAEEIDDALLQWGMPMGPLRLIDEIGVDITVDIANTLEKPYGSRDRAPEILRKMLAAKNAWPEKRRWFLQIRRQDTERLTSRCNNGGNRPAKNSRRKIFPTALVFLMVNEAARCLEEKVVATAEDADFGMMMGTGFAPFRGGPLRYADFVGAKKIVADMDALRSHGGDKFAPCDLLRQHAKNGTKFYARD